MKNDYPLFLPSVIATSTISNNKLTNEKTRLYETRKALISVLDKGYFKKIIIVDGSNVEILSQKEIEKYCKMGFHIEQFKFQQDTNQVKLFGKSNGEIQITEYMLENSKLAIDSGGFYKLSPRWALCNIDLILPKIQDIDNFFYYFHPSGIRNFRSFVCTSFYKTSIEFYKKNLSGCIGECGLDVDGYLESVFFSRLSKLSKNGVKVEFPFFSGIGGTLGAPITNRYYFLRNYMSKAGLLAYSF